MLFNDDVCDASLSVLARDSFSTGNVFDHK